VFGHINFGPSALSTQDDAYLLNVATHEMTHALGFSSDRMTQFIDANGNAYNPYTQITIGSGSATKQVTIIKSAKVAAAGQAYYGCPQLQGVELEDCA
jgi:hypothetical protein